MNFRINNMDKCPKCKTKMEITQDAYTDKGVIILHEVEKCSKCGEIILTEKQMENFVKKLKTLNLWKEQDGVVRINKEIPEFRNLISIVNQLKNKGIKIEVVN